MVGAWLLLYLLAHTPELFIAGEPTSWFWWLIVCLILD